MRLNLRTCFVLLVLSMQKKHCFHKCIQNFCIGLSIEMEIRGFTCILDQNDIWQANSRCMYEHEGFFICIHRSNPIDWLNLISVHHAFISWKLSYPFSYLKIIILTITFTLTLLKDACHSNVVIYILPKVKKKHKLCNKYMSMCFLSSYEHLKFNLYRVQINMLK